MNIIPISAFNDNYIWLFWNETTRQAWVVDPGEAGYVRHALIKHQLKLAGIFITHHHYDHSNGVQELMDSFANVKVYSSHLSPLDFITHRVKEDDEINVGTMTLKTLEIPGHTLDHTAFFNDELLFCGDTLFSFGCGKVFEGTPAQMYASLLKLKKLSPTTKVYCGHEYTLQNLYFANAVEPKNSLIIKKIEEIETLRKKQQPSLPSILSDEKLLNPFLRCENDEIIKSVSDYYKKKIEEPSLVFAALRDWKNHWKK
jgi:hydroxyacylglutathione hydrolase